ncbi:MAG: hypothetical protein VX498_08180 [Myxococcota bacterium]|nr:hypothetical protein [Myxococcota bacterium]
MARRTRKRRNPARQPISRGRLLGFTLFTLFLFWVVLEGALQVAVLLQPPQTHIPAGSELPEPLPEAYRILAVGDSWVFGAESEPEEAFVEVLARGIESDTGRTVQVYNFGESASNSSQALVKVHNWIDIIQPDLVLTMTGANNMLHDTGVAEAAKILGEDARLMPGWQVFGKLRTVRLVRQILVVRKLNEEPIEAANTEPEIPDLLEGVGGADPTGRTGLPTPPADHVSRVVELEWWPLFKSRDWKNGLIWIRASDPKSDEAKDRGFLKAWEAIFLAHLEEFAEAEKLAREAIELGGDESVAWEALAVSAERQDKPLLALQHRIRAADAAGFPWIRDRARALTLLELEAWEAAEAWLLWCEAAVPANLEVLLGLSRLPATTRAPAVETILADGPRGRITQLEFYRWHRVSSGIVDRMVASLGEEDPGEPASMTVARGRAAVVTEQRDEGVKRFGEVLRSPRARTIDRNRAEAELIKLAKTEEELRTWLGRSSAAIEVTPSNAPALVGWFSRMERCDEVIRVGQLGLAQGISSRSFEGAAGGCLSREVGWSLAEQALARGPVLDRAALVLGQPAGSIPGHIEAPDLPLWNAFQERRFGEVAAFASPDWRALALAHLRQRDAAYAALELAQEHKGDRAVMAYTRALLLRNDGDFTGSFLAALEASAAPEGDPWVRKVAGGIAMTQALRWKAGQTELLAALRVAPGYLEALEALSEVPQALRYPASEIALRYVPSGDVPADRWANWYLSQERFTEARLSLTWPEGVVPMDPESRAYRAIGLGRIEAAESLPEAARAAYAEAMALAEKLESKHLFCQAAARRALVAGEEVDDAELVVLQAVCKEQPDALDALGRISALRGECKEVHHFARKALTAGADPADIAGWMEPCSSAEYVDNWVHSRVEATHHLPANAEELLAHRIAPGTEDELPSQEEMAARKPGLLARQLGGINRLAESNDAEFVALTYPFPGAHHRRVRDTILRDAPKAKFPVLDIYGHFEVTFTEEEWQAMRTPEDHVNSRGYKEIGLEILRYLKRRGRLPRKAP